MVVVCRTGATPGGFEEERSDWAAGLTWTSRPNSPQHTHETCASYPRNHYSFKYVFSSHVSLHMRWMLKLCDPPLLLLPLICHEHYQQTNRYGCREGVSCLLYSDDSSTQRTRIRWVLSATNEHRHSLALSRLNAVGLKLARGIRSPSVLLNVFAANPSQCR